MNKVKYMYSNDICGRKIVQYYINICSSRAQRVKILDMEFQFQILQIK